MTNFSDLPSELRNEIYELALPVGGGGQNIQDVIKPNCSILKAPSLCQASPQCREEALPIYRSRTVFHIASLDMTMELEVFLYVFCRVQYHSDSLLISHDFHRKMAKDSALKYMHIGLCQYYSKGHTCNDPQFSLEVYNGCYKYHSFGRKHTNRFYWVLNAPLIQQARAYLNMVEEA